MAPEDPTAEDRAEPTLRTPEDGVWLEILLRDEEMSSLSVEQASERLRQNGFPRGLIDCYRARRTTVSAVGEIFRLAAAALGEREYLKLTIEIVSPSGQSSFSSENYCCTVMEKPPDGRWPSRGAYFRHPPESASHSESAWPFERNDAAIVGISAYTPEDAERLTIKMLDHLAKSRRRG